MSKKSRIKTANSKNIWSRICWAIALGRIGWEGLPEGTSARQTELFITNGLAVGFNHLIAGPVILPGYWAGSLNLYGLPNEYVAFGYNDQMPSFNIRASECVPFYNDDAQKSIAPMIEDTALRLSKIWETISINTNQQRIPWVYGGNEDEIESLKVAISQVETNQHVLFVTNEVKGMLSEGKKVFPTATPYLANDMFTQLRQTMNNFLTNLGIDNMPIEKKERQLADEVHGNASLVMMNRDMAMRCREEAAQKFNALTGMSIWPVWQGCTDCSTTIEGKGSNNGASTV